MNVAFNITKHAKDIDEAWEFWYRGIESLSQESKSVDSSRDGAVIGEIDKHCYLSLLYLSHFTYNMR